MAKYKIEYTRRFIKQARLCMKIGYDMSLLERAIELLENKGSLPPSYKSHKLVGNFAGYWECHLKPDWLLVWKQDFDKLILIMTYTGTHADLF